MKKPTLTFLAILFRLTSNVVWSETVSWDDFWKKEDIQCPAI